MVRAHQSFRAFVAALAGAAIFLPSVLASTDVLAKTVYVTPAGGTGFDEKNIAHTPTRAFVTNNFDDLQPGDVLKFLSDSADPQHVAMFEGRISLQDLRAEVAPLVIEGLGERTRIVGLNIDDLRACPMPKQDAAGCADALLSARDAVRLRVAASGPDRSSDLLETILREPSIFAAQGAAVFGIKPNPALNKTNPGRAACIDLERVDGLIVSGLHFQNCWLVAIRARNSSHITLKNSVIVGSSYGLAASGEPNGRPASHIVVEHVRWIQDASSFLGGDPFKNDCPMERQWVRGCPGDMWRKLPWGVVHHGAYQHFNGALLGGMHIAGDVIFRHNQVVNAFNGIRLTARSCSKIPADGKLPRTECRFNHRVWIYDNDFSYVRDNPVELEDWAEDAYIFQNQFHNAHAPLSFDGMGGGPVYVFGNVGWFDDRPTKTWSSAIHGGPCVHSETVDKGQKYRFDPILDRRIRL